jgi:hypothetical protein
LVLGKVLNRKDNIIGKLIEIKANGYVIENYEKLNNGDGLYFINEEGEPDGLQININCK